MAGDFDGGGQALDTFTPNDAPPPANTADAPDVRSLIDQSRKMGASDDQIRSLMTTAPFLQDTWKQSQQAGLKPDDVFAHFGIAPAASSQPALDDYGRPIDTDYAKGLAPSPSAPAPSDIAAPMPTVDEFGRDVSAPAVGQDVFNRAANAAGEAFTAGSNDLVTDEGRKAIDDSGPVGRYLVNPALKVAGAAAIGIPSAIIKGGSEALVGGGEALSDATGNPGYGQFARGVAGMGESATADMMSPGGHIAAPLDVRTGVDMARDASDQRFQATAAERNAQAVADIGRAPDIDSAIKAAGNAVSRPADATITVRPDPADIAGPTDAAPDAVSTDRASRIQAERDRLNAMRVPGDDTAAADAVASLDASVADPAAADSTVVPDRNTRIQAERARLNGTRASVDDAVAPNDAPADAPFADPMADAASDSTGSPVPDNSNVPALIDEPAAQSVGAAATNDLDPGLGDMTPKQIAAYRATAEGDRLVQSPEYGVADNTEYVRGVTVNAAERAGTVPAARELKAIMTQHPEVAAEQRRVSLQNADMREQKLNQITGTPIDIDNAKAAIDAQRDADVANIWPNKNEADIQPVLDTAKEILTSGEGRRSLVAGVVRDVVRNLYDEDGQPITDPEVLYGVGKHINDLLDKNDAGGKKVNEAARAQLMQLKTALYDDVIEPAAPGFKQSLDNYAQASRGVDEMKALQSIRPGMFGPDGLTYTKVNAAMKRIVDARQRPGLNDFKSISDDTMANLWDLRDDLRRSAFADRNAAARGSDTMQNAADNAALLKTGVGRALGRGAVSLVPGLGKAVKTFNDVRDPIVEANEARQRIARGMAMLRPDEPTVPRQDIAPRPAAFVPTPVQARAPIDLLNPEGRGFPPAPEPAGRVGADPSPSSVGAAAAQPGPPEASQSPGPSLYLSSVAKTPDGRAVPIKYTVREASSIVPSQLPDGRVNEVYPAELQPRDRTRSASIDQVGKMANTLDPTRLGYAADTSTGAPVVGADGFVESGNGRMMAIQQAYAKKGVPAAQYRAWLNRQGFDTTGMKSPVLVRERIGELSTDERAKLAGEMGKSAILEMSAPEKAAADAKLITPDMLSLLKRGDLASGTNGAFAKAFASKALAGSERGGFMADGGRMSKSGEERVRNALAQRAYGSNDLVSKMSEDMDPDIKAFGGAVMDAAPMMAKLRGAIEDGAVSKANDISPALVEAANLVKRARQDNTSVADQVAQNDAFSQRSPQTERILKAAFGDDLSGRMSRQRFTNLLNSFADAMQNESGMFGGHRTAEAVLRDEIAKLRVSAQSRQSRSPP